MSHLGFFSFLGTGHLNPATALGRGLVARGHRVTFFHVPSARAAVQAAGLEFWPIGAHEKGVGQRLEAGRDSRDFRVTIDALTVNARRVLYHAPESVRASAVDGLVVDQADLAAGSVAELLGLPFVTLSTSPPVYLNDSVPPSYFAWRHANGLISHARNLAGNALIERAIQPVLKMVNEQRRTWGLPEFHRLNDMFSKLAIITQLPEILEFPWEGRPPWIHYCGPLMDAAGRHRIAFPWDRLNGRPLVYASVGTIRNAATRIFETITCACAGENVQLVLSLGGGRAMPADLSGSTGEAIIVHYAPQLEILRRAAVTITHAGLNTALESLAHGVPAVAIPIADDQPGVAARLERAGAGTIVPARELTVDALRQAVLRVLNDESYRKAARRIQEEIKRTDGIRCASEIIERVLSL